MPRGPGVNGTAGGGVEGGVFAPLSPGTVVDRRYRVRGVIGSGGMGTVYRAEHLGLGRDVALKVIHARGFDDDMTSRLEREARAASRLEHSGCVRVLDYGRSHGRHYLAMELLEGPTLGAALAEKGVIDPVTSFDIVLKILEALAHAHERGVLHRDVKPSNVMLCSREGRSREGRSREGRSREGRSREGGHGGELDRGEGDVSDERIVLIDFGLARIFDEAPLTARGICPGSPSYTAPERLRGHPYDQRADLYSTGVVAYEMMTGQRPFTGKRADQIVRMALTAKPPSLEKLLGMPPIAAAVVERALAKSPAERYPSARAMISAFERARASLVELEEETTLMRIDVVRERPNMWQRLRRFLSGEGSTGDTPTANLSA
jgi:serine/threonine protein kinase